MYDVTIGTKTSVGSKTSHKAQIRKCLQSGVAAAATTIYKEGGKKLMVQKVTK